jgi:hypothetical protein
MNWEQLLTRASEVLADGVPGRFWGQLRPLMGQFGQAMTLKWGTYLVGQSRCGHRYRNHRQCREAAVGPCEACGEPVCMAHGRFSLSSADIVCEACVEEICRVRLKEDAAAGFANHFRRRKEEQDRRTKEQDDRAREREAEENARQRQERGRDPEELRAMRLSTLGLSGNPPWTGIHNRFRNLAKDRHPDRFPPGPERQRAERDWAEVTAAYHGLKEQYDRKAAAA